MWFVMSHRGQFGGASSITSGARWLGASMGQLYLSYGTLHANEREGRYKRRGWKLPTKDTFSIVSFRQTSRTPAEAGREGEQRCLRAKYLITVQSTKNKKARHQIIKQHVNGR